MKEMDWRDALFNQAVLLFKEARSCDDLGDLYCYRFIHSLEELMEERYLKTWKQTRKDSRDDHRGVDFWLVVKNRGVVPFGVTSTESQMYKRKRKHPGVQHIFMRLDDKTMRPYDEVKSVVKKLCESYLDKRKKSKR